MSIRKVVVQGILDDIRRGDHIIFGLNTEGHHPSGNEHYGLVQEIYEDYVTDFKEVGKHPIGTVITHESEDYNCWFHGIVTHGIVKGWPTDDDDSPHTYEAIQTALDSINAKYEDSIPLAAKSVWLGRGSQRKLGAVQGNIVHSLQSMANSDLPIDLYVPDGWVPW